jgi:8-oxo-dGTP diphosphatase
VASTLKKQPVVGVGAVIWNPAGEVLLVRRGQPPRLAEWSIPGGKVEWGETVQHALHREVREETGLEVEILGLIDVVDSISTSDNDASGLHYVLLDFAARSNGSGLRAGDDVSEARWVTPDRLADYRLWSETRRIIELGRELLARS